MCVCACGKVNLKKYIHDARDLVPCRIRLDKYIHTYDSIETHIPSLYEGGCHHNDGDIFLPHHPPEVRNCVVGRALSRNVLFLFLPIALRTYTCFNER